MKPKLHPSVLPFSERSEAIFSDFEAIFDLFGAQLRPNFSKSLKTIPEYNTN
jgi:hypothetical protein